MNRWIITANLTSNALDVNCSPMFENKRRNLVKREKFTQPILTEEELFRNEIPTGPAFQELCDLEKVTISGGNGDRYSLMWVFLMEL